MGIYGESMTLVTEGKIMDKIKNIFNKVKAFKEKKNRLKQIEHTRNKAFKEALKLKYIGVGEFFKEYKITDNSEKIFCFIDTNSANQYIENIKNIFGTDNISDIKKLYEKYNKKEFSVDKNIVVEIYFFTDILREAEDNIIYSVDALQRIKKRSGRTNDIFLQAAKLQIDIFEFLFSITEDFIEEFDYQENSIFVKL